MKALIIINKIALFSTLFLYIIIIWGLIAQILLGFIQVVSAIILTYKTFHKSKYAKKHLSNYWIATSGELLLVYLCWFYLKTTNNPIVYLIAFVFPISIAIYFYAIMIKIAREYDRNEIIK